MKLALDYASSEATFAVMSGKSLLLRKQRAFSLREGGQLIPWIRSSFADAGLSLSDVQEWIVGTGPGGFTGLRTAASAIAGLAAGVSLNAVVTGVPSALGMVSQFTDGVSDGQTAAVIYDGRNQEFPYYGVVFLDGVWLPNRDNGVIEQSALGFLTDRFSFLVSGIQNEKLLTGHHIKLVKCTDAAALICSPIRMAYTDLIYLRPAVFVNPKPIRENV